MYDFKKANYTCLEKSGKTLGSSYIYRDICAGVVGQTNVLRKSVYRRKISVMKPKPV